MKEKNNYTNLLKIMTKKWIKIISLILILIVALILIFNNLKIRDGDGNLIFGKVNSDFADQYDGVYLFDNFNVINEKGNLKIRKNDDKIAIFDKTGKALFKLQKHQISFDEFKYNTLDKIIAVSDIEGNFKVFSKFLINNKVIDSNFNWIFGKGHLVCNGDFFDRGDDVTACLWLVYKIEQEAEKQGGKVHFIIGNHEEMNVRGNVKYVRPKYTELATELNIPYKELYGKDAELGKWLRTKNTVIIINDVLFTHGGISTSLIDKQYTLEEINRLTQKYLGYDKDFLKFINPRAYFLFDRLGPMWYRGYFGDYKDYYKGTTQKNIDDITTYFSVNKIVVGHTIVDKVKPFFENKIIAIDAIEENDPRKQDDDLMAESCQGLLIDNYKYFRIFSSGKKELMLEKK